MVSSHQPQIMCHAAAMKHVLQLEHHPFVALENNLVGTLLLLEVLDHCCQPAHQALCQRGSNRTTSASHQYRLVRHSCIIDAGRGKKRTVQEC